MNIELNAGEARVIGCLIEKEITTPDYYPLTLNSLTTACNQKSNRDPVTEYSEAEVLDIVDALIEKRLISDESRFSGRVNKYQHRFCNTEFGDVQLTAQELGVICCLLLRGAQTPGELRTRTNRLCQFKDVKEAEAVLEQLVNRQFIEKLGREAGKRESRFRHLFTSLSDAEMSVLRSAENNITDAIDDAGRIAALEQQVQELREEIDAIKAQIDG